MSTSNLAPRSPSAPSACDRPRRLLTRNDAAPNRSRDILRNDGFSISSADLVTARNYPHLPSGVPCRCRVAGSASWIQTYRTLGSGRHPARNRSRRMKRSDRCDAPPPPHLRAFPTAGPPHLPTFPTPGLPPPGLPDPPTFPTPGPPHPPAYPTHRPSPSPPPSPIIIPSKTAAPGVKNWGLPSTCEFPSPRSRPQPQQHRATDARLQ